MLKEEQTTTDIARIDFDGHQICLIEKDDNLFVPLKPICTALDLDWGSQFRNIQDDIVLSSTVVTVTIVAQDGKQREMLCLPLAYLNGWLFRINPARYEGERRERIVRYQNECYHVLFNHFYAKTKDAIERKRRKVQLKRLNLSSMKTDLETRRTLMALEKQAEIEAKRIQSGKGTLAELIDSPKLYELTRDAIIEMNNGSLFPTAIEE